MSVKEKYKFFVCVLFNLSFQVSWRNAILICCTESRDLLSGSDALGSFLGILLLIQRDCI